MSVDCIARNVIDQIGFEDYRLASDVKREEAEARGENLIKLMGVVLCMEDRDSRSLRSLIGMILGQEKWSRDRCASRQSSAPNKKISTSNTQTVTPKADKARL